MSGALNRFKKSGDPFSGARDAHSAGNGCLMRLAPIPMFFHTDRDLTIAMSAESARTTHGAVECVEASQLFGAMLYKALSGATRTELDSSLTLCVPSRNNTRFTLRAPSRVDPQAQQSHVPSPTVLPILPEYQIPRKTLPPTAHRSPLSYPRPAPSSWP